ncbi:putative ankyrin repeat protein RF_0381 [Harmonia axyridis]|uniref:putative ankyrin repeat protein RF_0381 n=1 Tax=Harmonia axyridis TaxID=115357 RepID=UPI001E278A7E|nr:putative ankyrin repeat protein RF_0381 [Harmonia axyridis]
MGSTLWPGLPFYDLVKRENKAEIIGKKIKMYLTRNNININEKKLFGGYTVLHHACSSKIYKFAEYLLKFYIGLIDTNALGLQNETPLHLAINDGNKMVIDTLLRFGANPNIHRADDGKTALHLSCSRISIGILQSLLNVDTIEINARDLQGWTPLHYAVREKNLRMIKLLIHRGADPNAKAEDGKTPLHIATCGGCRQVIVFLLEKGATVNVRSTSGSTPLHLAVRKGNEFAVLKFLEYAGDPNWSPRIGKNHIIHSALMQNNKAIFATILKYSKDVDAKDSNSLTALQKAVDCGDSEAVRILLQYKPNTNITWKNDNKTLLLRSVEIGNIKITKMLLESRAAASINVKSKQGRTPLIKAVEMRRSDYVRLLLEYGADKNIKNKDQHIPLFIAVKRLYTEMISFLA